MYRTHLRWHGLVVAAVLAALGGMATTAHADARDDIEEKTRQAMENFDLLDFDGAKKLLQEALQLARKKGIRDSLTARVHINLGIVEFSGFDDQDGAREQFAAAVDIDGAVEIDPAYSNKPMAALLAEVKKEGGGGGGAAAATVDCSQVDGLEHELVLEAPAGQPARIVARTGRRLKAKNLALFYRPKGVPKFVEAAMKSTGRCEYAAEIPADALNGDVVHYYIAALNARGKKVASKGSTGSPNIIEIKQVGGAAFADDENPLGGSTSAPAPAASSGGDVGSSVGPLPGADRPKLFLSLAAGTGAGYVTGETETAQSPVGCCFAPALLHVFPEIGYYLTNQMAVSLAFRFGFPVGANIMGHATGAPAGLLRVRYALEPAGDGVQLTGSIGGGLLRHTIKIEDQAENMNVDTTASGPVMIGGGAAYVRPLSGPMKFVAELNALAAFTAGVSELGDCPGTGCIRPSFGLQFDANLGILFAF